MSLSEFQLIERYFMRPELTLDAGNSSELPLGNGDDCALIDVPADKQLAVSMDLLQENVHFPSGAPAAELARRALAVNLSDLAAMGARPLAFTLGLSLPQLDEDWLEAFSGGLAASVQNYRCPLIGGDITRGPLGIAIQVHGLVDRGRAITRAGATPGDHVYVSGTLGTAGLAPEFFQQRLHLAPADEAAVLEAFYRPQPRLALGMACGALASAAIDVSDGLLADCAHLAQSSGVGLELELSAIPCADLLVRVLDAAGRGEEATGFALRAGDDYELVLSAPPAREAELFQLAATSGTQLSRIGRVVAGQGVQCLDAQGQGVHFSHAGYQHFS